MRRKGVSTERTEKTLIALNLTLQKRKGKPDTFTRRPNKIRSTKRGWTENFLWVLIKICLKPPKVYVVYKFDGHPRM